MTIETMQVQGSNGVKRNVPLDSIVGETYTTPIYKTAFGDEGDETLVSDTSPLPVTIAETPLPDDAATATNQSTIIGHVDGIETLLNGGLPAALGTGGGLKIDGSGTAVPVAVSSQPFIVDAFQRVAVGNPTTLFDSQFQYDLNPLVWEQITASNGGIAHRPNECSARLSTSTDNGSTAALQTKQYFRYQPGKAQQIFMTFVLGAASSNVRRRAGYFEASNGFFLEQNGTTDLALVRRTGVTGSPVDNRVTQANWNMDTLDGNGPSGKILDLSKSQILVIDMQFLGVGRVRVGFDIDGVVVFAHEFLNANTTLTTVYMTTANLPLRYEQYATTGAAAASMDAICSAVISSGGFEDERGYPFGVGNTTAIEAASGARTAMLGIRPNTVFNSIANRTTIIPFDVSLVAGTNPVLVEILYNATLAGGSWAAVDSSSAVQANITPTGFSNGIPIANFHVGANGQQSQQAQAKNISARLPITLNVAGASPIELVVVATGLGGASDCYAAINWKELR
jgi:hypothetical protein